MKSILYSILFLSTICKAQEWQAEVMVGVSGYNGDLTQKEISFTRMRPSGSFKLIYNTGDFINLRLGFGYGKVVGDDKFNKDPYLKDRNLSFQSNIFEVNFCAEFNLFDPSLYNNYPYLFMGVGLFHFDPYAYDNSNKKIYLKPLSTEGQGLNEYPDKKPYSLTQFCLPMGFGWKMKRKRWEVGYELGYRVLFTDYLDDVSKTYTSLETLLVNKGAKSVEMAFRGLGNWSPEEGGVRGNSKKSDTYFFGGLRFATTIGKSFDNKTKKKNKTNSKVKKDNGKKKDNNKYKKEK